MAIEAVGDLDIELVEDAVGAQAFQRGQDYVRRNRVLRLRWDETRYVLVARVLGRGEVYETTAYFEDDDAGSVFFLDGECSCPVGFNCKHVAAAVLAAVDAEVSALRGPSPVPSRSPASSPQAPARRRRVGLPTWEQSLQGLLGSPDTGTRGETPLAIELTLAAGVSPGASSGRWLTATIVRPGRKGWVNGGLSWAGLDSWQVQHADYVADHLLVLRELYALYRARTGGTAYPAYYPSASTDKAIDFATFGPPLWALLDEANRVGLRLRHAQAALGEIEPHGRAELCLDVTATDDAGLMVTPALRVETVSTAAMPVGFIGESGHGVVFVEHADLEATPDPADWRLGLARLAAAASPPFRQMVRSGQQVEVPASDRAKFAEEIWPRLRHIAAVVSPDGSFTPPSISEPRLVLRADYGPGHALDIAWEWAYDLGTSERRASVDADPAEAGFRDPLAEQALVASLDVGLEPLGLRTPEGLNPRAQLSGLDTMRFTTEVLPLLTDEPGIVVEVTGSPADFREVSDSLVIGLSTESVPGETDWFDLGVTITVDGRELPFVEVFSALAAGVPHLLLVDGAYFSLEKPELQALRELIEEARALQDSPGESLRISRYQAGFWEELCQLGVVNHQADAWERQVGALLAIDSIEAADLPKTVTAQLRPYQRDGFGWLSFLWQYRLGGILADDMGLGKTLQTLALICHANQADPASPPFLIVAPTSVVPTWVAEATRFAPDLSVVAVADTLGRSGRTIDEVAAGADVVVTTYTLFRLDFEAYNTVDWAGLVLDEAQNTKNHRSKVYGCIRQLGAPFKLAITGTPMENNLMELWSLLSITAPGLFPSPTRFAEHYARPIERRGDAELLAQLRRRIKPLIKRRTKEHVAADLPAKQEQVLDVELHPRHRKIYQTHLQRERQKVLGLIDDFDRNRFTILRSLTLLRQLSLHPVLIDDATASVPCVKLDTLVQQMGEVIDGGHRALVFSQFTGFLSLVRERLDREGIDYCYLDGRTRKRDTVLRRFKEGTAPAFLISLKAGGSGLNLTEADYCFLLDPWWNPATEAQAIDRTHRIGQTRNVIVYRLVARDTIEEKVVALKERKAKLFSGVLDEGDLFSGHLDTEDIRALFS
ncbi:MAG: SNF2-related protein [Acidimicrobiales bacterium]